MAPRQSDPSKKGAARSKRTTKASPRKGGASSKRASSKKRSKSTSATRQTAKSKGARRAGASPKSQAPKRSKRKKQASNRVVTSKAAPPRRWGAWLAIELGTIALGLAIGLGIASLVLWNRAERDVQAWIDAPRGDRAMLVLSAPMEIQVGQPLDLRDLAADLLAAGFEEVRGQPGELQFHIEGERLSLHSPSGGGLGRYPGGEASILVRGGRVAATEPEVVILPPTVLARLGDLERDRILVPLDKTGPYVGRAIMAMEDARFRQHFGVDPSGLLRATMHNLTATGPLHGGSTLTQQLAKNLFLSQERTSRRKVRELFAALALERRFTKDELLEIYLNEVYLGQVGGVPIIGVERAARAWFGRSAANLSLAQAAVIAGVISAPNAYSPARHPERAQQRASLALDRLQALGWVEEAEIARAKAEPLELRGVITGGARLAPWAVDAALEQAERSLGEDLSNASYHLHTTIQPHLQRAAVAAVTQGLHAVSEAHPEAHDAQAALVAVRARDGAVVAIVGGRDYAESPYDRASHALREIGSTVKPLTLAAVLDHDSSLHAQSKVIDEPISRKIDGRPWTPRNYDGKHLGEISLRETVEKSRNVPAVKMAEHIGPQRLQRYLRDLGLDRATNLPSAALGGFSATPTQLAGAYSALAGGGDVSRPRLIEGISTPGGRTLVAFPPQSEPIYSARAAAITSSVLQGAITHGTARGAQALGAEGEVGAKTGTTNEGRDAWVAGITPHYAVVTWVGRDRGSPLGLSGGQAALPIWGRFVSEGGVRGGRFYTPDGLVDEPFCRQSGRRARDACPDKVHELFPRGQVPRGKCDVHGGPVVESASWIRRVFTGKRPPDVEGEGQEAELAGD